MAKHKYIETDNKIINALAHAWNLYVEKHGYQESPADTDDLNDFRKAIHDAQRIVITKEVRNGST